MRRHARLLPLSWCHFSSELLPTIGTQQGHLVAGCVQWRLQGCGLARASLCHQRGCEISSTRTNQGPHARVSTTILQPQYEPCSCVAARPGLQSLTWFVATPHAHTFIIVMGDERVIQQGQGKKEVERNFTLECTAKRRGPHCTGCHRKCRTTHVSDGRHEKHILP